MEKKPFESLGRGWNNRDLGDLLDTKSTLVRSTRQSSLGSVLWISNVQVDFARSTEDFLSQEPSRALSDRFDHELAIFPRSDHVVINKFGAFIPQSIFGNETELAYNEAHNQGGAITITVHAKQSTLPAAKRPQFGSAHGLIKISDDFDEPLRRDDPIFDIGREPIACGISDASENLDKYLYGGE